VPRVDAAVARKTFAAVHHAIDSGLVRACHDLSEGGLAAAVAEMAFAGGLGARLSLKNAPHALAQSDRLNAVLLFSESNSRFLCEVPDAAASQFEQALADIPHARIGKVISSPRLEITGAASDSEEIISCNIAELKAAWQSPLDWN
jgi:phosphoribosylformylglycinamidine synthase